MPSPFAPATWVAIVGRTVTAGLLLSGHALVCFDRGDDYMRAAPIVLLAGCLNLVMGPPARAIGRVLPRRIAGSMRTAILRDATVALVLALASAVAAFTLLDLAGRYKISLNGMPITETDLELAAKDIGVVANIAGLPSWVGWAAAGAFVVLAAAVVVGWGRGVRQRRWGVEALALPLMVAICALAVSAYGSRVHADVKQYLARAADDTEIWTPEGIARLAVRIGPVAFLSYSADLRRETDAPFFNLADDAPPLSPDERRRALGSLYHGETDRRPNVVMIHLESIFDPNRAFLLRTPVVSSLFSPNAHTKLVAPFRVNIIGGGSWVTEFEVLTGLDTRAFGHLGYYAHKTIGPHVRNTLPGRFGALGYRTVTFYATSGLFYDVRNVFRRYGFTEFFDRGDLELAEEWTPPDPSLAEAAVARMPADPERPLFAYVVTNGAHSPYRCSHFESAADFESTFADPTADWAMNCELNEYLRLMRQSEVAVERIRDRLVALERETGRPFVLLIYGDHQPHAFTGTWKWVLRDYSGVRTAASRKQTFVHVMSSLAGAYAPAHEEIPSALVPALLRALVGGDDVVDAAMIHLFGACGSDPMRGVKPPNLLGLEKVEGRASMVSDADEPEAASLACRIAQRRAMATLAAARVYE